MGREQQPPESKPAKTRFMFADGFEERRDLEQYFWTDRTILAIDRAITSLHFSEPEVLLCTPSLACARKDQSYLLDIDDRFASILPRFIHFDLRYPEECTDDRLPTVRAETRVIVFDPPFFYIPMQQLYEAVLHVCEGRINTMIMIGFLKREEKSLLSTFAPFHLKETNLKLEYRHTHPNKWLNYRLYANFDAKGMRRLTMYDKKNHKT